MLESLSLDVSQGEIVCLQVPWLWKTTLLKAIAGLPLNKTMRLNGKLIDNGSCWQPPEQRNIGMIFQDYAPHLTCRKMWLWFKAFSKHDKSLKIRKCWRWFIHWIREALPASVIRRATAAFAIARSLAYNLTYVANGPFSNIDTRVIQLIGSVKSLSSRV